MTELLEAAGVLLAPLLDPASRTFWPLLLVAAGVAAAHHLVRRGSAATPASVLRAAFALPLWRHRSFALDAQLLLARRALALIGGVTEVGGALLLATTLVRWLDRVVGRPEVPEVPTLALTVGYSLVLFVAWDASRYLLHRALHTFEPLWQLHQVHHSAEVLTPLTFHRIHPLESALYTARGVLVDGVVAGLAFWLFRGAAAEWTIAGVHGIGLLFNAATGNLRHSHVWLRFGPAVERWLLSPAQHQLHHAIDGSFANYGTWLACWDRWGGTLAVAPDAPPRAFGLPDDQRNHAPDDLLSALFGPVRALVLAVPGSAHAAVSAVPGAIRARLRPVRDLGRVGGPLLGLVLLGCPLAGWAATPADPSADPTGEPSTDPPADPATEDRPAGPSSGAPAGDPQAGDPQAAGPSAAGPSAADPPAGDPPAGDPPDQDRPDGQDPPEDQDQEDPSTPSDTIIVTDERGVPRVAGSAHVVTEEELARYEYDDIHKVLARVPGVYVRGEDGFGLRPNIGLRGANSDRSAKVTLLEDGLPLAPAPYAAPAAYYFPITTRLAGVEVFKGPASLEHGPQTIGGAINLRTRGIPEGGAGALDLGVGLRSTAKAHAWAGASGPRAGLLVEGAHLSTGGFKELDGGGPTGFQRQDLMLKGRLGAPRDGLELKLGYGRELSNETYLGVSYADWQESPYRRYAASQDDVMRWDRTQAELAWDLPLGRKASIRTAAWHHWLGRTWTKLNRFAGGPDLHDLLLDPSGGQAELYVAILRGEEDTATPDQVLQLGTNDRTFHSGGVQSVLQVRIGDPRVHDDLELGVRVMRDDVLRVHTEDPFAMTAGDLVPTGGPTETLLDSHTRATALAGWLTQDIDLGRFQVLPGARVELIRTWAAAPEGAGSPAEPATADQVVVLPGIGLFGEATAWLDLFAGVHRGFSPVAPGQPEDVGAETALNYEAGLRARPGETHAELVGYLSDYQNVVGTCTLSGGCGEDQIDRQYNGGQALVYGVEALLSHDLHLPGHVDLTLGATYTLTRSRFLTDFTSDFPQFGTVEAGDALPYVPEHQGGGQLVVGHPRASLALGASARSGMRDVAGQGRVPVRERIPPLLLLDLAGELHLTEHVAAYANATNLTGTSAIESWRPFGARPVAPLQATVGVKVNGL